MNIIEVTQVQLAEGQAEWLQEYGIKAPEGGNQYDGRSFEITGWAFARSVPAVAVEILAGERVIRRMPLQVYYPYLAATFPAVQGSGYSGFRTTVSLEGTELALELRVVLADQRRIPLATIQLRWSWWDATTKAAVPPIAVIITSCNQAHFLGEAIESSLNQTYPHAEILVVDAGSTDNTAAVAARYPGVRYLRQAQPGLAQARNMGLRHSHGHYVVFLDAADRLLPHALETGLETLNISPEAAFVYGACRWIAFNGLPLPTPTPIPSEDQPYAALLKSCHIMTPAVVMYRRGALHTVGGFDPVAGGGADYAMYLRLTRQSAIVCHNTVVAEYRRYEGNTHAAEAQVAQAQVSVLRRERPYLHTKPALRQAYLQGMRNAQRHGFEPMIERARAYFHRRMWLRLVPSALMLLSFYPREIFRLFLDFVQARLVKTG
ncbi:MAG: glycosyltransferase [Oscillochloridaceae bacterium umkhey_bin13]